MSGLMKSLFGGSSAEQKSYSTSNPLDMQSPEFKSLRGPFSQFLMSLFQDGGPKYEGDLVAPIGANEKTVLDQLMQSTGPNTGRQDLINRTIRGDYLGSNPFLTQAIEAAQRPTLQGLEETVSRALPGRFTQAGHFTQPQGSSAFDRAAAVATRGAADAIGDIATNMSFASHEAERGRQQEAISLSRAEVDTTIKNLQAQALPRLIQDMGIERGMAEFQRRTQTLLQVLQTIAAITNPVLGNQQVSQSWGTSSSEKGIIPGLFPKGLGGGGGG